MKENDLDVVDFESDDLDKSTVVSDLKNVPNNEAEEFASKIIARAATLNGVKIDRESFLRSELKKHCPELDIEKAIHLTPFAAGVTADQIDRIAHNVIDYETKKCASLSFISGIPGGAAMAATVPADLAQYFVHVMRVEQKLAYLYGWHSFLNDDEEVDDETIMEFILLMGVMLGVGSAASSISKFASTVASAGVTKTIQRQALTKTAFYPVMKKVLQVIGVKLTKETFAKAAGKVVPVVGGVVSGGLTYASFKPGSERLRKYLRSLPISGMADIPEKTPESSEVRMALEKTSDKASEVSLKAAKQVKSAGSFLVNKAKRVGTVASEKAKEVKDISLEKPKNTEQEDR